MTTTSDDLVQVGVTGFGLARPTMVPKERYTSDAFAALELERLWPRVWQIACSVDHVAAAGDWYEYRVGTYSVIVVRGDDGELRAFQNVCRHRGNSLCQGAGGGLTELRCPFHRWAWDLRGR
jgi:phenylpropionate dioxygenase-like ring-hydroxylating dioxygenase large terminal subunit